MQQKKRKQTYFSTKSIVRTKSTNLSKNDGRICKNKNCRCRERKLRLINKKRRILEELNKNKKQKDKKINKIITKEKQQKIKEKILNEEMLNLDKVNLEKIERAKSVLNFSLEEIQSQIIMECFGHSEFTELKFSKNQWEKEFTKRIPKILKLTDAQLFKIKEKINKLKIVKIIFFKLN
uniref:Uncharacterized protein n=1 Tax=Meloidogyne enterolobii TaxID=390850 RepID=A0A6V7V243_MELEN|nr:unnamed protein product [Meloidogyne enterolobii]